MVTVNDKFKNVKERLIIFIVRERRKVGQERLMYTYHQILPFLKTHTQGKFHLT